MDRGFGIIELLVALTMGLCLLGMVVGGAGASGRSLRRLTQSQDRLESIFHTVDTIKSDLCKCGMRLQEAARGFGLQAFSCSSTGFQLQYGSHSQCLLADASRGDREVRVEAAGLFPRGRSVLLYNVDSHACSWNEAAAAAAGMLQLSAPLGTDFQAGSELVAVRRVEYRWDSASGTLRRRSDRGGFQPLLDDVTDFYVAYFADAHAVLYRLEIGRREQVRGYLFLTNLVEP